MDITKAITCLMVKETKHILTSPDLKRRALKMTLTVAYSTSV